MKEHKVIGTPVKRVDGYSKVTGAAIFGADVNQPNQLYGAVYRSPYPHAIIKSIDTSAAKAYPGVRAVVTGQEKPIRYGACIVDEPFLAIDKVRYYGEPVAAVAADTLEIALEAVKLIKAEYEVLPVVTDAIEAMSPDSPLVHDNWDDYVKRAKVRPSGNVCDVFKIRKGDTEAAFKEAEVVVENQFSTEQIQHVTIETHVSTVMVDKQNHITCWTSAQSPFIVRNYFCNTLGLRQKDVRVIGTYVGGGFGSKYDLRAETIAYMLASEVKGRPVKVVFSRTEDFIGSLTRGAATVKIKTGASKEGKIVAQEINIYWDTGAYATLGPNVAKNGAIASCGPYEVPNVTVNSYCVVTNKPICGAYRGFGVPETNWPCENQMDALAEKLGMDPLELRRRNSLHEDSISVTGEKLFSVGLPECIEEAGKMMGWTDGEISGVTPEGKLRGRGVACFLKMTSSPSNTSAIVKLHEDASATIMIGGSEMGQGSHTFVTQVVQEELRLPIENISVAPIDTEYTPFDKTTTSSRFTFMMGNALINACADIKNQLRARAAYSWKISEENIVVEEGIIKEIGGEGRSVAVKDIGNGVLTKELPPLVGRGSFSTVPQYVAPNPETGQSARPTAFWIYGTQAAEVEVDPNTGEVEVVKFAAAHDCGKALNPHTCKQQVEGAIVMGLGHALREELIYVDGYPKNANMVDYKVPTVRDFPAEADIVFVDAPHKEGPYGAKGVGETALTATCAAVGLAVSHAIGTHLKKIPIKAEDILNALAAKSEE